MFFEHLKRVLSFRTNKQSNVKQFESFPEHLLNISKSVTSTMLTALNKRSDVFTSTDAHKRLFGTFLYHAGITRVIRSEHVVTNTEKI